MYGYDEFHVKLSVIFHREVTADDVTTLSTGGTTVGHEILNNGIYVLLQEGPHCLKIMRQLYVEGYIGCIQQQFWFVSFFQKTGW